jgi:hypothetical protein
VRETPKFISVLAPTRPRLPSVAYRHSWRKTNLEHLFFSDASPPPAPAEGYPTNATAAELAGVSKMAVLKWCRCHSNLAIRPGREWLTLPKPSATPLRTRAERGGDAQG